MDASLADEVAAMDAAVDALATGTPIYRGGLGDDDRARLREFFLLTDKPAMALVNLDEEQLEGPEPHLAPVREAFAGWATTP